MKLTKKLEAEIRKLYEAYWNSYINGDPETYASLLDEEFKFIGSTEAEALLNKTASVKMLDAVKEQMAGKAEFRNRNIKVELIDELIQVSELCDGYILVGTEWNFYSRFRLSSLLKKKRNKWKFIHQHVSMPDSKAQEGEAYGLEQIRTENIQLRDAVKRRTVELETKNRELEIETALEKVRSRANSMHRSENLHDVINEVNDQLRQLGFSFDGTDFLTDYSDKGYNIWLANFPTPIYVPAIDHKLVHLIKEVIKRDGDFFTFTLTTEEKNIYFKNIFENTVAKNLTEELKKQVFNAKGMASSCVVLENIILSVTNFASIPYSDTENEILKRFAKVFQQSYTRFLDLQKAEAQAREAQIETALEKVRGRAMAMHKSEELLEAGALLYSELSKLGIEKLASGYMLIDEDGKMGWNYGINPIDGQIISKPVGVPLTETKEIRSIIEAWKKQEPAHVLQLDPGETIKHQSYMADNAVNFPISKEKLLSITPERLVIHTFNFKHGYLIIVRGEVLSAEQQEMVVRFAKVFEMTYRRFLDLQKAEAQARESHIQLALERVRARTMAMQKSDELQDAAILLFQQIRSLGVQTGSCGFNIWNKKEKTATVWMSSAEGGLQDPFDMPLSESPIYRPVDAAMKKGDEFLVEEVEGKNLVKHFDYLLTLPGIGDTIKQLRKTGYVFPKRMIYHFAFFNNGYLSFHTHEPYPEAHDIFKRFAKVFEQTYTRFLDLQKAEAQAREAQIELGLERVRARAMAMQNSAELSDLVDTVFKELTKLDFAISMCIINIIDESTLSNMVWGANPDTGNPPDSYYMKFEDYPFHHAMMKGYKERNTKFIYVIEGDEKRIYDEYLFNETEFRKMPKEAQAAAKALKRYVASFTFSNFGGLQTVGDVPLSDANLDILSRFGKVFDLTYTRFNDLKQAEAQSRESQIQLALERVRARTMAMQKSDELAEAASLLFTQIADLGTNSWSSGFIIFQPDELSINSWMSKPDGSMGVPFNIPVTEDPFFINIYEAYKRGEEFFVMESSGKKLEETYKYMFSLPGAAKALGVIEDLGFQMPSFQITHCVFFTTGFLMFITYEPCQEMWEIFKRFGKVFEQTYTRFLDLQKAESQTRAAQIELAVERVRAKALAMHNSPQILDVVTTLRNEMLSLEIPGIIAATIYLQEEEEGYIRMWDLSSVTKMDDGFHVALDVKFKPEETDPGLFIRRVWNNKENYFVEKQEANDMEITIEWLRQYYPEQADEVKQFLATTTWKYLLHPTIQLENGKMSVDIMDTQPPFDMESILVKMGAAFDLAYKRFLDLQKAEAQARESHIQLALERVRARTMAMQHSDELKDAAALLFQQVKSLGVPAYSCGYNIWEKNEKTFTSWMSTQDGSDFNGVPNIPLIEDANFIRYVESKQNGEQFFVLELRDERMQEHYEYLKTIPAFKAYFDYALSVGFDLPETQIHHLANFSQGNLLFITLEPCPEFHNVFKRFAAVFEQTYTRFLDLQKAEAQAKEAQIEAALEKVRSRSLAMHTANELGEVVTVIVEKLKDLGVVLDANGVVLCTYFQNSKDVLHWIVSPDYSMAGSYLLPYFDHPIFNAAWQSKENGDEYFSRAFSVAEKNSFFEHAFEHSDYRHFPDEFKQWIFQNDQYILSFAWQKNSAILIPSTTGVLPSEEDIAILKRFVKVFEQSYVRFLDLQKAEAQAREAQIELALERVRARTMAMQRSDELPGAATILFQQVQSLGMSAFAAGYCIWDEDKQAITLWMSSEGILQPPFKAPTTEDELFIEMRRGHEEGKSFHVVEMGGEKLVAHYQYMRTLPVVGEIFDSIIEAGHLLPTFQIMHHAYFSKGFLLFITYEPVPDAHDIFKRFAKVFEQTYTRFLDLQKAEAQAREAKIEAGLERVRSRSMAMHNTSELQEVIHTVHKELLNLNIAIHGGSFIAINRDVKTELSCWGSGGTADTSEEVHLPLYEKPFCTNLINRIKSGSGFFTEEYTQKEKKDFFTFLLKHEPWSKLDDKQKKEILSSPGGYTRSCCVSQHTSIFIINHFGEKFSAADNDILQRFAKVFEQTYTRFLDLQKVEAQAKESQIQLALERVRARTMAMQKSDELMETAVVLFDQLNQLGEDIERTIIGVMNEEERVVDVWATRPDGSQMDKMQKFPIDEPIVMQKVYGAWQQQKRSIVIDLQGEELEGYFQFLKSRSSKLKRENFGERRVENFAFFSKGMLGVINVDPNTRANVGLYERFAAVFDQTYKRFLDLQKSEAQAREAQIEAALERVRSRSMGMQKSEELKEVIQVVYEQFVHLNIHVEHTGFVMDYKTRDDYYIWIADPLGVPSQVTIPYFDCVYYNRFNEAKKKGEDFFATNLDFEEKNRFYQKIIEYVPGLPEESKEFLFSIPGLAASTVLLDNVCLYIENFSGIPYSDEENKTLMRFGKVFQQTYTRFLDLQKAEAQALESQVEAALERVRSRTMAMQHSDELKDAALLLFKQVQSFGVDQWACGYNIWEADGKTCTAWMARQGALQPPFKTHPAVDHCFQRFYDAKQRGESFYVDEIGGDEIKTHYKRLTSLPEFKSAPKEFFDEFIAPEFQIFHIAYFEQGYLMFITYKPVPETWDIFKRFAKVFEQTYTRFLDLLRAEASAREATIEASLERVRAKAMSMHNSQDLSETVNVFFKELKILSITPLRCGVGVVDEIERTSILSATTASKQGDSYEIIGKLNLSGHPVLDTIFEHWKLQKEYYPVLKGTEIKPYYEAMNPQVQIPDHPDHEAQYGSYFYFKEGLVFAWTEKGLTEEEIKIFRRFTSVISLTYRRYMELQKSETNAREAVKQASLDRIRADIASMRTVNDLQRITPLIWDELTIVGVPFIRCGVFIMDEEQKLIHTFLSTPDGKAIGAFHLPYDIPGNLRLVVSNWKSKNIYTGHWNESEFHQFAEILAQQGALESAENYLKTIPHGGFYLHFLPFLQGMLYVGNTSQLNNEEIKLIQAVADAFSTAYARYEDFNKLELANEQIENTLTNLKQAQAQLVQSEKMASLGELTAGIAHEIQNPLNFVNNFSEVNTELIAEMKDEIEKGNIEEVKAIANDIADNEQKINHHGKRADAIVKGMLQHSRSSSGVKESSDINVLADEYLRLAYHGLRAKDKSFNATMKTDYDETIGKINIVPQEVGRSVLNLITNAFYAVSEKKKQNADGYEPTVTVTTKRINGKVEIRVADNGNGIPQKVLDKIFQPFFTTKPTGQGTGLGLSLSYDIVKAHGGEINVMTREGEGSEFNIQLPS